VIRRLWPRRRASEEGPAAERAESPGQPLAGRSEPGLASADPNDHNAEPPQPSTAPEEPLSPSDRNHHLATVAHEGRFWDVYVEVVPQASPRDPVRGRLVFSAPDGEEPVTTAPIFVEPSVDQILERARELGEHRLIALLRSCLP